MSKKKKKNKRIKKIKKKELNRLKTKGNIVFFLFLLFFLAVIYQVLVLEITHTYKGTDMSVLSREQLEMSDVIEADRGVIYDSAGNPLAVNIKEYKMTAVLSHKNKKYDTTKYKFVPYYIQDPVEDGKKIIEILGLEDDEEAKELIMSQLMQDPNEVYEVEFGKYGDSISLEEKNELEAAGIEGLEFQEKTNRYYPYGDFASYIIGYARQYVKGSMDEEIEATIFSDSDEDGDVKIVGEMGVEKLLDSVLEGTDGKQEEVLDKQGVPLEEPQIVKQKSDGANVYLTLDSNIQSYVHDYMEEYTKGQGFDSAMTIVMDADTGAILAGEKIPSYDPNLKNIKDYQDPYLDYCFEPGSIIKTFLVAEAMKEGKWNPSQSFVSGKRTDERWGQNNEGGDNYIADWVYNENGRSWGSITLEQGYYFSSNVGMTYLLDEVGYDNWVNAMKDTFEFGEPVQNQFYESSACTFDPEYDFEIATTSFGQGMTANVMQILRAYSMFSGDGRMVNPYLVEGIEDPDTGEVVYKGRSDKPENWVVGKDGVGYDKKQDLYYKQIITEEQNEEILNLMENATYYNLGGDFAGTGLSYGKHTKYRIGSKTGTAEVSVGGVYDKNSRLFSAVIMAPVDDPQIILYTSVLNPVISEPQGYMKYYTGAIIDATLDYLKGETKTEIEYTNETDNIINLKSYTGKDMEEEKSALKEDGFTYKTLGEGVVRGQYPSKGTKISIDTPVYLIGEKIKAEDYLGLSKYDASNFCLAKGIVCKFSGDGKGVTEVKYDTEKDIYNVKLEVEATTTESKSKATSTKKTEDK